jgi:hypothetical protein
MGWVTYLHWDDLYEALLKEGLIDTANMVTGITIVAKVGEPCTLTVEHRIKSPSEIPAALKKAGNEDEALVK